MSCFGEFLFFPPPHLRRFHFFVVNGNRVMAISTRLLPAFLSKSKHLFRSTILLVPSRRLCSSQNPTRLPFPRAKTPLESQFESWVDRLGPGCTDADISAALRSQSDPDLALDLFRWTALRPGYRHTADTYLTMLRISVSARRYSHAETLVDEVLVGACPPDLHLFNAAIHFCCFRRHLFSKAFDLFKKMQQHRRSSDAPTAAACRPSIETYSMLLAALLRRFGKPPVSYVYLHSVRLLVRQMKASGVIPDTFAQNLVIKAFSKCLEMDEAVRVFKEMGLYGCEPNDYSYGYIVKGLCEKGRIGEGMDYFKEMREKGFVAQKNIYMALICSLALERRFEAAIEVLFDMLGNGKAPDLLTYRTLLEGLCREGRADEAFELLDDLFRRRGAMNKKMHSDLLEGLHWLCKPPESNEDLT